MCNHLSDTTQRPRLSVLRSNSHMYAQIIDNTVGRTLIAASTLEKGTKNAPEHTDIVKAAVHVDKFIAERAEEQGISAVVFNRGGFLYMGRIQVLADAARGAGLQF